MREDFSFSGVVKLVSVCCRKRSLVEAKYCTVAGSVERPDLLALFSFLPTLRQVFQLKALTRLELDFKFYIEFSIENPVEF